MMSAELVPESRRPCAGSSRKMVPVDVRLKRDAGVSSRLRSVASERLESRRCPSGSGPATT